LLSKFLRLGLIALLSGFLYLTFIIPVYAILDPDNGTRILDVGVFRNIKEAGDQLYYVRYDVSYLTEPTEPASDAFQIVIYDIPGTSVLFSRDLNYYQHNITSIYLTAAQALTWDSNYIIRVQGNVGLFVTLIEDVNMDTWTLNSSDYHEETEVESFMLDQAAILEADWGLTLLNTSNQLNSTGAIAFNDGIPGLIYYYPTLYGTSTSLPTVTWGNWTQAYVNTLGTHEGSKLHATMTALGGFIGVTGDWMAFWLTLMAAFVLGGIVYTFSGSSAAALTFAFFALPIAVYLGLGSALFSLMGTIFIVLAIGFGIVFILARFA
jgi:hypothetical protein